VVQHNKPNQDCRIEKIVHWSWYELGRTMLYAAQVRIPGGVKRMFAETDCRVLCRMRSLQVSDQGQVRRPFRAREFRALIDQVR
jgi:hypothetical protein